MHDPYRSPESTVETKLDHHNFQSMPRIHTLLVILLLFATFGLYIPYWAITRAKRFNEIYSGSQVNMSFTYVVSLIYILSAVLDITDLASAFTGYALDFATNYYSFYLTISLSSSIGFLIWVFHFRARMNNFLIQELNNTFNTIGVVLTFFFGIIYLNFKINQTLDDLQEAQTVTQF